MEYALEIAFGSHVYRDAEQALTFHRETRSSVRRRPADMPQKCSASVQIVRGTQAFACNGLVRSNASPPSAYRGYSPAEPCGGTVSRRLMHVQGSLFLTLLRLQQAPYGSRSVKPWRSAREERIIRRSKPQLPLEMEGRLAEATLPTPSRPTQTQRD